MAVQAQRAPAPQTVAAGADNDQLPEAEAGGDILINILDAEAPADVSGIKLGVESAESGYGDLEMSYAEKLDNIALKTNRIFGAIITVCSGWRPLKPSATSTTCWSSQC